MLDNNLRILQLNIMKSRAGMEALISDHQTQNLDVLLIQEPYMTTYRTHRRLDLIPKSWYFGKPEIRLLAPGCALPDLTAQRALQAARGSDVMRLSYFAEHYGLLLDI
ncbi:hypothetical protein PENSUB_8339 [Penicillium subrubescens]|uniref:Endonuclease/exonuclease/phosphatase domain-containing protein n=1 Tax=Penicillium subrubescens TaxID=1316194 RepID=A0A1Q5THI0_9EURO|nr:hypothetical protein PENSUB_8339 [Penicillium subrubescens]